MPYDYITSRWLVVKQAMFIEDATSLTHTATFNIPAGFLLLDIWVVPIVVWGATTSATFICGDGNSSTGW